MAKIELEFEEIMLRDEKSGVPVKGVRASCPQCGETQESFGTGSKSRMRCLMLLKEQCEETDDQGRGYFYVDPESDERPSDPKPKPWWER